MTAESNKIRKSKGPNGPWIGEGNPLLAAKNLAKSFEEFKGISSLSSVLLKQAKRNLESEAKIERLKNQNEKLLKEIEQLAENILTASCDQAARCIENSSKAIDSSSRKFIEEFIHDVRKESGDKVLP